MTSETFTNGKGVIDAPWLNDVNTATYTTLPAVQTTANTALSNSSTALSTANSASSAVATETTRATTAEALLAPIASPTFTGTPAAPTATVGTNTTQVATTAFVLANSATVGANNTFTGSNTFNNPVAIGTPTTTVQAAQVSQLNSIANISATATSGNLTVTLASMPLQWRGANNATPVSAFTGAISVSTSATLTTSLGATTAQQTRLAVICFLVGGTTPTLGLINLGGGVNLDETASLASTAISGGTSASTAYTTAGTAASYYRLVGFVDGTWTNGTGWTVTGQVQGIGGQSCVALSGLGIGQSWQTVTRTSGTTYYNTTGKPIVCVFQGDVSGNTFITVNGVTLSPSNANSSANRSSNTAIIPPNASYVISTTLMNCQELR